MFEQNQQSQSQPPEQSQPVESASESEQISKPSSMPSMPAQTTSQESEIETPELAKKEVIQRAEDLGGSFVEEKIHTMPEKFKKTRPNLPIGKGRKNFLILVLVVILIVAAGGFGFYFWTRYYKASPEVISEETVTTEGEQPIVSIKEEEEVLPKEEIKISPEQTLKVELKNESDQTVSSAEFHLLEGALSDLDIQVKATGLSASELNSLLAEDTEKQTAFKESSYQVIGGLYKIEFEPKDSLPQVPQVFKPAATLTVFYHQDLVDEEWENDLILGYFKDNLWTPLPSSLNAEDNILTIDFEILPSDTLAIIVDKEKIIPKIETFQIAPNIPSSVDSDNDGLTDVEEIVFSTEINNPDSDADGNPDGQEIIGLMHPLDASDVKLATSGLINVYTNPTFSYSLFYPASWLARAIPETDNQEVLIITNTGEFFSVTVENNPERLSPTDWYLRQSPKVDRTLLFETVINNSEAVWNSEHLTVYLIKEDRVYILSYNTGTEKEANFKTIFEMLINSFQFVVQPQGRPDGTLIKYPDKPEIYLIEKGLKRAFQSGEIFERLGFRWEDIIEIPLNEAYLDGEIITGRLDGTLIKYPDSPAIYLVEGGKKRSFKSGEIFESLGYKWGEVIEISSDEIYPDGPIIESGIIGTPTVE